MKLLVTSDLHYRLKQFDWLVNHSHAYDAVAIVGDVLDISSMLDLDVQIDVIKKYLERISGGPTLLICSGNHDGNRKNTADEFIAPWLQDVRKRQLYVDGDNVLFGSTLITIFPWWDGPVTQGEVARQFEQASQQTFDRWLWLYHAPPDRSPTSWTGKRFFGDAVLNDWIKQYKPDIVLTGHIHQSPFKPDGSWVDRIDSTWVFNAGSYAGDIPPHIVLDLDAMQADWFSLAGNESCTLV
jgi:Icc-related predicted phosphoesterase